MTIKEVKSLDSVKGYCEVEIYRNYNSTRMGFHTDRIKSVLDDYSEDDEVIEWELMDKEDYSNSILANSSISWNDFYDDDDKVLVIKIK